ncbi:UvrD-helicase domain-containing protein (plasmid) [Paenibacillus urinalis]|uniref:UvrD-helicase domain-containing protein n=1 Tax=Paenibacillus urinalis TaxID=521520 RepID=A0AAX3N739_9BACL|nr:MULTISPECIES: UvrD-helicase domain-containing protein [Paenibacillus]MCM3130540.1 UvrD-helicase domain-containing protein [Paenibacillus sp. MER 78]WDH85427.1 UvrD-helicase domain-containing protein [Paenibacillus urinalis]WDH95136.1 UvrD-helicase domain-containing protein [Paenibacillus urinalis]WDI05391.1 UvrD-helicase domain-containing protein [Paenibacillus urinalis]
MVDQEARDKILEDDNSILVSASAGSGKTTIMVQKMGIELSKITDHKTIAAITFTVKATEEIKRKAQQSIKKPFVVMTNDSFIENEITRPFLKDAFGSEYSEDYSVEYGNRYKFTVASEGLMQIKQRKILGTFFDNKKNFKFKLALAIISKSVAAQEYIKSKYATIFIDEYQDSDQDMHRFFMYLKNELKIKIFIVGDAKQAIYMWRGAMSNIFELLSKERFSCYELVTNFRCHKDIENYANIFHNPQYFNIQKDTVHNVILKNYQSRYINEFPESFTQLIDDDFIDLNKEIAIISNINRDAKKIAELLNEKGFDFVFVPKTPIDEGLPNGFLLKELAMFTKNTAYTIYDFMEKVGGEERSQRRVEINKIIGDLKNKDNLIKSKIGEIINNLGVFLGLSIGIDEVTKFYESVSDPQFDMAFQMRDKKHKVMTVFGSKGLEFDQVISFTRYYEIYNNTNMQNHYVCVTRAKEKFVMFVDDVNYHKHVLSSATKHGLTNAEKLFKYIE